MAYHIDAEKISLEKLRSRIESTDLVPSRACLQDGIAEKFEALKKQGIHSFGALRKELKNAERMKILSASCGVDADYLNLLRREIESYFPKPFPLRDFDWLPVAQVDRLAAGGISTTQDFYETSESADGLQKLAALRVDAAVLEELSSLCDLTRVQWTSPLAAKIVLEAGYKTADDLARADADVLCVSLEKVNTGNRFFKGKIGLRDVKRLVHSAKFV